MDTLTLPEPIAASLAAKHAYRFLLVRGPIASLEITA